MEAHEDLKRLGSQPDLTAAAQQGPAIQVDHQILRLS
jgi:hypothetical protein